MSMRENALARLIVVLGPTASGKSALGIRLAEELGGEVLVCDSTQVYRHFDIGTAKVPLAEQHVIPHHLVDLVEPTEVFTAGEYRRRALDVLQDVRKRNRLPILTAGTGLYLRALLLGLAEAPERSEALRERLREKIERRGPEHLHSILKRLDRETARRIPPRDTQKIIRAIEIRLLAGKSVGEVHGSRRSGLEGYRVTKIGLLPPRAMLYARIDARVDAMIRAGWIEEVARLALSGVSGDAKPFQFIGYSQLRDYIAGKIAKGEAIRQIQQATRRFAKRQLTWFRREPDVHWLSGFGDSEEIVQAALKLCESAES
jgi:tRNA dimethylallyltransferase